MPFEDSSEPFKSPAVRRHRSGAASGNAQLAPAPLAALTSQKPPDNLYATSIHTLVSAILKMSRKTTIPRGRKAYRGLARMRLGSEWFSPDERGARSGVELGFMSTTLSKHVALEYSGVMRGGVGTVLEFQVGAVDCGARLDAVSQYQGLTLKSAWTALMLSAAVVMCDQRHTVRTTVRVLRQLQSVAAGCVKFARMVVAQENHISRSNLDELTNLK
jgi:hypothetical protein